MKVRYLRNTLLKLIFCLSSFVGLSQTKDYRIVDQMSNIPLSNVTIKLDGKLTGFHSDRDGKFSITQAAETVLLIHVGYKDLILNLLEYPDSVIRMCKSDNVIEEVYISTGYQNIPKERVTGSFELITEESLNKVTGTDIFDRLEGQSSILFDKSSHSINANNRTRPMQVRGRSTLYANSDPLIILDNLPFEGDLFDINPNDVASISILKDAAAASIWGARAGNGVIVITTKQGRIDRTQLELVSNFSISDKPYLYRDYNLNSPDFLTVEKMLFEKGFYDTDISSGQHPALSPYVEALSKQRNNLLTSDEVESLLSDFRKNDVRKDYLQYFYRNPINRQFFTSLSNNNKENSSRISIGYDNNSYNLKTNSFERWTFNGFNKYDVNDKLDITARLVFSNSMEKMISPYITLGYGWPIMNGNHLYPYARLMDDDGKPSILYRDLSETYLSSDLHPDLLDWRFVPLDDMWKSTQKEHRQQASFLIQPVYRFGYGISIQSTYQYQKINGNLHDNHAPDSYYARNLINLYSKVSQGDLVRPIPVGGILDGKNLETIVQSWRGQVAFDRQFGYLHHVNALSGAEIRRTKNSYDQVRRYGYNENNGFFSEVDFTTTYNMYDGLSYVSLIPNTSSVGWTEERFVSFFALANYSYAEKHNLSGSLRKDASNIFGVRSNNKWSPFWSLGYSWNIHNEKFSFIEKLDRLVLRTTWGYSGNVDPSRSALVSINYASNNNAQTRYPYATLSNPTNESLRWEKIGTLNVGMDFVWRNSLLSGSLDYYKKSTIDLIGYQPLDPSVGFLNVYANNANTLTHGFDLKLQSNYRLGNLQGTSSIILGHAATKVTKVNLPPLPNTLTNIRYGISEGKYYNPVLSFPFKGLSAENGNPLGILGDEVSDDYYNIIRNTPINELIYHGSSIPLYYGNFSTTFAHGDFSVFFNFLGKFDYYFRRSSINYQFLYNRRIGHYDYNFRWQKPGDEGITNIPSAYYPVNGNREDFYTNSSILVTKGDHIRLQDVRLDWRIRSLEAKYKVEKVSFFLSASNLGIIWSSNKLGIDPVYSGSGIPPSRMYTIGTNFKF